MCFSIIFLSLLCPVCLTAGGASSSDGCDVTDDDCLAWCGPEVGGEDDSGGGGGTTTACRLRGTVSLTSFPFILLFDITSTYISMTDYVRLLCVFFTRSPCSLYCLMFVMHKQIRHDKRHDRSISI